MIYIFNDAFARLTVKIHYFFLFALSLSLSLSSSFVYRHTKESHLTRTILVVVLRVVNRYLSLSVFTRLLPLTTTGDTRENRWWSSYVKHTAYTRSLFVSNRYRDEIMTSTIMKEYFELIHRVKTFDDKCIRSCAVHRWIFNGKQRQPLVFAVNKKRKKHETYPRILCVNWDEDIVWPIYLSFVFHTDRIRSSYHIQQRRGLTSMKCTDCYGQRQHTQVVSRNGRLFSHCMWHDLVRSNQWTRLTIASRSETGKYLMSSIAWLVDITVCIRFVSLLDCINDQERVPT
jgi:hypothetical protein